MFNQTRRNNGENKENEKPRLFGTMICDEFAMNSTKYECFDK